MRWSQLFIPTLREEPTHCETASHRLLVRAGFIRQMTSGVYSLLPLAQRIRLKVMDIIRDEMQSIGAQEFLLSSLQPIELWKESGRLDIVADIMFCLKDRRGAELALGLTHEEAFASIAKSLSSHKQLPQIWYQMQLKFRDEIRPKGGLLRVREFTMKDSYSFDCDPAGLELSFLKHKQAYQRIFSRCGLKIKMVEANSGAMGGNESTEFMLLTDAGEDTLVCCSKCGYAANIETAESSFETAEIRSEVCTEVSSALCSEPASEPSSEVSSELSSDLSSKISSSKISSSEISSSDDVEKFATPGIKTIVQLEEFEGGASARDQIKTLVFFATGIVGSDTTESQADTEAASKFSHDGLVLALVEGGQELNETKLQSILHASSLRSATVDEIYHALGAHPGSLGAVGVKSGIQQKVKRIVCDSRLKCRSQMVTGANQDDYHYRNVMVERDIAVDTFADLHTVKEGDGCIACGAILNLVRGLEVGHIFNLGTRYSKPMNIRVLNAQGERIPVQMGSYGIGVERLIAAVAEQWHDEKGLRWPLSVAPFDVLILPINVEDEVQWALSQRLYREVAAHGLDVLLDDRAERAGVKFNDADLIGVPIRVTVGRKAKDEIVEVVDRVAGTKLEVSVKEFLQSCSQIKSAMVPTVVST